MQNKDLLMLVMKVLLMMLVHLKIISLSNAEIMGHYREDQRLYELYKMLSELPYDEPSFPFLSFHLFVV